MQIHKGTSLLSSWAGTATPTILLQDQKNTRHKASRPPALQRPGGGAGAGRGQGAGKKRTPPVRFARAGRRVRRRQGSEAVKISSAIAGPPPGVRGKARYVKSGGV